MATPREVLEIAGREVTITNPDKVFFPVSGLTKLDLVAHYLAMGQGVLRAIDGRPMALKRYVHGIAGDAFYQKRAPEPRPEWIETVELRYPSGRSAREIVIRDAAQLAWVVNLGCVDLHPHSVRADDLEHPDELRIDLDPIPGVPWSQVREVALAVHAVLTDYGLVGWPKTSGSRGMHIYTRLRPGWTFTDVHRAGLALAREVERRVPDLATSRWWKEERHGVFIDYNQNAKDRTTVCAYSVRPTPDARVSAPLRWPEVADCEPGSFTVATMPARLAALGDLTADIDDSTGELTGLIELAQKQADAGMDDGLPQPTATRRTRTAVSQAAHDPAAIDPATPERPAPRSTAPAGITPAGRRKSTMPLIEIARAASSEDALAGLERWKQRHPTVWPDLAPSDVLIDSMRGRSSTWTRVRVNLRNVPVERRPEQEPLEVDYDPWKR